jgi:hypothetical protein
LKERESELVGVSAALNECIAGIETQMKRELAAWSTAREEQRQIHPR